MGASGPGPHLGPPWCTPKTTTIFLCYKAQGEFHKAKMPTNLEHLLSRCKFFIYFTYKKIIFSILHFIFINFIFIKHLHQFIDFIHLFNKMFTIFTIFYYSLPLSLTDQITFTNDHSTPIQSETQSWWSAAWFDWVWWSAAWGGERNYYFSLSLSLTTRSDLTLLYHSILGLSSNTLKALWEEKAEREIERCRFDPVRGRRWGRNPTRAVWMGTKLGGGGSTIWWRSGRAREKIAFSRKEEKAFFFFNLSKAMKGELHLPVLLWSNKRFSLFFSSSFFFIQRISYILSMYYVAFTQLDSVSLCKMVFIYFLI